MWGMSAIRRRNLRVLEKNGAPGRSRTCDPRLSHDGTTGSDSQVVSYAASSSPASRRALVRKELVMKKVRFVGLDVHADTIAVAVAEPGEDGAIRGGDSESTGIHPPTGSPRLAVPRARRRGPTPASSRPRGSCAPASKHRADPSSRDRRLSSAPRWARPPRTARRARSAANRGHTPWGPPRNTRAIARVIPAASPERRRRKTSCARAIGWASFCCDTVGAGPPV